MFGEIAVKHIAMLDSIRPPKKAIMGISRNRGLVIRGCGVKKLEMPITARTIVLFIVARVAPHNSSPATTSSMLIGVATMASKVFWKYMRTNEP